MEFINFELFSFGGETGRRAGFKIQYPSGCEGSSPSSGTTQSSFIN